MAGSLSSAKVTKKYAIFLPKGAKVINFSVKATGHDCDICGHTPEKRDPKPGYPTVSEEMRVMRVQLPEGMEATESPIGRKDFTVTGNLIEINVCEDTTGCRDRAAKLTKEDGSPKFDPQALKLFR